MGEGRGGLIKSPLGLQISGRTSVARKLRLLSAPPALCRWTQGLTTNKRATRHTLRSRSAFLDREDFAETETEPTCVHRREVGGALKTFVSRHCSQCRFHSPLATSRCALH